ncbi:MAG TPA: AAA family ATPase [Pseudonocardiaceae bacterium]|nr:AAA family ATPase [Pseudonocardiaceae bacterium]
MDTQRRSATTGIPRLLAVPKQRPCEFVGRSDELGGLAQVIDGATVGTAIVQITGDPWIGKTKLLSQFVSTAAGRGWTVLSGSADAGLCGPQTGVPFHAFTDALDELMLRDRDRLLVDLPDEQQRRLTEVFPALDADGCPVNGPDDHVAPDTADAIHALLRSLRCPCGLLLVVDDAHFADQWSLDLLVRLAHQPPTERFVLALAYRGRQADLRTSGIFDELAAHHRTHVVELSRLTDSEASTLLPDDLNRCHQQELLRDCAGNPGVLRAFAAVPAQLRHTEDRIYYLPREALAAGLREFRAMSRLGWLTARSTAVVGGSAEVELIKVVAELTETEVWMALDELTAADVLRYDHITHRFDFRDPLVRTAACRSAGPGWRIGAHHRAAAWLRERGASPVELAHHLLESGDTHDPDSVDALLTAAEELLWHRPAYALSLARATVGSTGPTDRQRLLIGCCLTFTGPLAEASRELAGTADPDLLIDMAVWQSRTARLLGDFAAANALVRAALDRAALERGTPAACARLHAELIAIALEQDVEPADADVAPVRAHATEDAGLLALLGQAHARRREWDEAAAQAARAAQLCDALTDDEIVRQPEALLWLGRTERRLDRYDDARRHLERAVAIAERRTLVGLLTHPAVELAALVRGEDAVAARRHVDQAAEAARLLGSDHLLGIALDLPARSVPAGSDQAGDPSAPAEPEPGPALELLSERELEIAVLVSEGRTNQQIARALRLSHKTVETYLARIFKKLDVCSRTQIATMIGRGQRARISS